MAKQKLKRTFRTGNLSREQAARDAEIRRKVQMEFPPVESAIRSPLLSDPLKKAIAQHRKSVRQLAEEACVSQVVLTQFLAGRRDLRLATAEKLAQVLGLRLVAH